MERRNVPIRYYSSVAAHKVDWLWYPYVPFGKITIIQGDPGDGKTTLVLNIAALLSNGTPMPESEVEISSAKTIYQSAEDSVEDTLKPRLVSAGADCTRIAFIDESESGLTLNDHRIEDAIIETGARLVVLDPLQAYLSYTLPSRCWFLLIMASLLMYSSKPSDHTLFRLFYVMFFCHQYKLSVLCMIGTGDQRQKFVSKRCNYTSII